MAAELLEREPFLRDLAALLADVAGGRGQCVLVSGEAGIGKSALVERFAERHGGAARFLWGRCEALFTPRPLGPLHDIAQQLPSASLDLEGSRSTLFSAFLAALGEGPRPTVAVIEDVHWADEATLDLLKFLGRRIQQAPVLLIATYRDDEVGPEHPLWFVLGDLPSRSTRRMRLPPLSRRAVVTLAYQSQRKRAGDALYEATSGNPFFVTEVLASDDEGVPETVRAAVLRRAAGLSPQGRAALELASVVPAHTEWWLFEALLPQSADAIDECTRAGALLAAADGAAFRHELARQAVASSITPARLKELHSAVLGALLQHPAVAVARLVHHATLADDGAAVLRFAPTAARQAARQGAHREAARHYRTALRYAEALPLEERADLLDGLAYECYLTDQFDEAAQARTRALALWRERGDGERVGDTLRWLSRLHWFLGDNAAAERYAAEAIAALEPLPPGRALAMAYSNLSQLRMLAENTAEAVRWGRQAVTLAEKLNDMEIVAHALNNIGTAQLLDADEIGRPALEKSLEIALKEGFEEHAARAYTNLGCAGVELRNYPMAARFFDDGIAYCTEHDLDSWRLYMSGWRAQVRLEQGDWDGAGTDATNVLASHRASAVTRIPALAVLGWVRLRRGDPGSAAILDEAHALALKTGEAQRIVPVAAARAEAAWLRGDLAACRAAAQEGYALVAAHAGPWQLGLLCYWLWKVGDLPDAPPRELPDLYMRQFAGDWQAAAAAWKRIGCPYEQALALAEGDAAARRTALAILERLGARPAAERLKQQQSGAAHGPVRGPRSSTRGNPAGLTNQQLEVLLLMARGQRNTEIAEALHVSVKTVEHHVSAVLLKLNARSRAQAAAVAHRMGIIAIAGMGDDAKIGDG